ncbi:GNAT family N-acetyltransferase [Marinicella rhabdoformis]|uniref:GNAT family N-acetyltransferase n=1 Tax=Marinicella rhabdoformis TaxID=2580566 RepID=UPI0012AEC8BD|nr:GNAT family N-acetyltransferase [Marinicella rhabdoformis]
MKNIRNAQKSDFNAIVQLNQSEVDKTSPMDGLRLEALDALACYHKVVEVDGVVAGFLFAMDESADYENDNFAFFQSRYERFVYIDRIVISKDFAGMRLGSALYEDLFECARLQQVPVLTCEFYIKPLNVGSLKFHQGFGFKEVGTQTAADGIKLVSLQAAEAS